METRGQRGRCVGAAGTAVAALAVSALLFVAPAFAARTGEPPTSTAAADAEFYVPPVPLPEGKPGSLIRSEPIAAPPGARAWRVLVHTRSMTGSDAAVSGIVVAPKGRAPEGGRPIVSWAHGTTGLADSCAPSKAADAAVQLPWVTELLAAGYVVAATDYQGLGTPGVHPYLVGESEGRAVLDAALAARKLPTGAGRRVLIAGHSQGGHAALFAGEIAARYAPKLRVLGVAPGAPVTDITQFLEVTAADPFSVGFLVMGAEGYRVAYPQLDAFPLLSATAAAQLDVVEHSCAPQVLLTFAGDDVDTLFTAHPSEFEPWSTLMRENSAGNQPSVAPVLLWQGSDDVLTPEAVNAQYVPKACAQGSTVEYKVYPGENHGSVLAAAHDDVLAFFAARLRRAAPVSSCP